MDIILVAAISITAIGSVCAAFLCIANKVMYVKVDERIAMLEACMPGANCGACGFPGCSGYAKALVADPKTRTNACPPGGAALIKQISEILGVAASEAVVTTAIVHCMGDVNATQKKMDYKGIQTCYAAKEIFGGAGTCPFGCLGYGDCELVCPSNAICIEGGLARIQPNNCTGCGLCVKACPTRIITIEKETIPVAVLCSNIEKGAVARKNCAKACIACRKCVKECPAGAIAVEDNLARIDYEKCTGCGQCAEPSVCMPRCIQLSAYSHKHGLVPSKV